MVVIGAGDIARPPGPGTFQINGVAHGAQHHRILTLAQIIVGTPHGHRLNATVPKMQTRPGELAGNPFQIGENPIIPFGFQAGKTVFEELIVVHYRSRFF